MTASSFPKVGSYVEEHNKILDKYVGLKIRERRKALGMTQAELAEVLALSHQQIQRYESGENTISMASVLRIAQALNVKPDCFYENAPLSKTADEDTSNGIIVKTTNRPIRVLLVEDVTTDELLFRKAAEKSFGCERTRTGSQLESMCYLPNAPREVGTDLSGRAGTHLEAMS